MRAAPHYMFMFRVFCGSLLIGIGDLLLLWLVCFLATRHDRDAHVLAWALGIFVAGIAGLGAFVLRSERRDYRSLMTR